VVALKLFFTEPPDAGDTVNLECFRALICLAIDLRRNPI
jgi:hypothetical protein